MFKKAFLILFVLISFQLEAQQDPQFTQYMYNTITVNPGYAGSRGHLSILGMHRSQWVGINGAPRDGNIVRNFWKLMKQLETLESHDLCMPNG